MDATEKPIPLAKMTDVDYFEMNDYVQQYELYRGSNEWNAAVQEEAKSIPKPRSKRKSKKKKRRLSDDEASPEE